MAPKRFQTAGRAAIALTAIALATGCEPDDQADDDSEDEDGERAEAAGEDGLPPPDDVDGPPDEAEVTDSGLAYKVLEEGDGGSSPGPDDRVEVHYTGWTTDGEMFDSSEVRDQPAEFPVGGVIPGWTEGLQLMSEGDSYRLWIPEELAYGGQPGRPQGMLVFDVELLSVSQPPEPPEDLEEPPESAEVTDSGLAYRVVEEGDGDASPRAWDEVTVDYSGWTTDGEMFDSTSDRGAPASFPLAQVIPGWTEGIQKMTEGDTYQLWIPEELAYEDNPRGPQGMLVFEVELHEVNELERPPSAPDDVSEPPPNAEQTEAGVYYRVLEESESDERPDDESVVEVHYTGWTTDGEMFDTSIPAGEPATFPLGRVIEGWADGLKTMTEGQRSRLWIPEELAYGDNQRGPQGMLVFDVELLSVEEGGSHGHPHGHAHPPPGSGERADEDESAAEDGSAAEDESAAEDGSAAEDDDGDAGEGGAAMGEADDPEPAAE